MFHCILQESTHSLFDRVHVTVTCWHLWISLQGDVNLLCKLSRLRRLILSLLPSALIFHLRKQFSALQRTHESPYEGMVSLLHIYIVHKKVHVQKTTNRVIMRKQRVHILPQGSTFCANLIYKSQNLYQYGAKSDKAFSPQKRVWYRRDKMGSQ